MVTRALLVIGAAAVVAGACAPGKSCGIGRCGEDEECISIFGLPTATEGIEYIGHHDVAPFVDGQHWCVTTECEDSGCSGSECLRNPIDDEDLACVQNNVAIEYLMGRETGVIDVGCTMQSVVSYQVENSAGTQRYDCQPEVPCAVGSFSAANEIRDIPTVALIETAIGSSSFLGLPAIFSSSASTTTFNARLPDRVVTMYVSVDCDSLPPGFP